MAKFEFDKKRGAFVLTPPVRVPHPLPRGACPCACQAPGGFCGGCGHAGCAGRR